MAGIRVVDLTRNIAGPFCGLLLGDLGAEVIKIEHPEGGDELRTLFQYPGRSPEDQDYFAAFNRNKRSVGVDLKTAAGKEILRRLLLASDVFIENLAPGAVDRLGFGEEAVRELKPELIYCSISGFGKDGGSSRLPAYDGVVQAATGLMLPPTISPDGTVRTIRKTLPLGDLAAALFAALSITANLAARNRTGVGEHVDIAMFDCLLALQGAGAAEYFATGEVGGRGTKWNHRVPQGVYPTADGRFIFITSNNSSWPRLSAALALEELLTGIDVSTNQSRLGQRAAIDAAIRARLESMGAESAYAMLVAAGVPCSVIRNLDEALESQTAAERGMLIDMPDARGGRRAVGSPMKFARRETRYAAPPVLGADTVEVLHEILGYDPQEISAMTASGTICSPAEALN